MVKQQLSDGGDNMGTHAHIGYIEKGKIHYIYCHYDGYKSWVGRILQESYTDPEKIKQLIALGDISSLGPNLAPESGAEHDILKPAQDTTFAYHRDRGESWDHTQPRTTWQLGTFFTEEFNYLINLDDPDHNLCPQNKWVYSVGSGQIHDLKTWYDEYKELE